MVALNVPGWNAAGRAARSQDPALGKNKVSPPTL